MRCPQCKKPLDLTNGEKARAGDYCICKKCGSVLRFLNPPDSEPVHQRELNDLQRDHPLIHRQIVEALLAARKTEPIR